jgi:hypothetical protein
MSTIPISFSTLVYALWTMLWCLKDKVRDRAFFPPFDKIARPKPKADKEDRMRQPGVDRKKSFTLTLKSLPKRKTLNKK